MAFRLWHAFLTQHSSNGCRYEMIQGLHQNILPNKFTLASISGQPTSLVWHSFFCWE